MLGTQGPECAAVNQMERCRHTEIACVFSRPFPLSRRSSRSSAWKMSSISSVMGSPPSESDSHTATLPEE